MQGMKHLGAAENFFLEREGLLGDELAELQACPLILLSGRGPIRDDAKDRSQQQENRGCKSPTTSGKPSHPSTPGVITVHA